METENNTNCQYCGVYIRNPIDVPRHEKRCEKNPAHIAAVAAEKKRKKDFFRQRAMCNHDYEVLSHEEERCAKCGDIRFTPDMD